MKSHQMNRSPLKNVLAATENLVAPVSTTESVRDAKTSHIGMKEVKNTTEKLKMLSDDIEFLSLVIRNRKRL